MIAGWGYWKVEVEPDGDRVLVEPEKLQVLSQTMLDQNECKKAYVPTAKMVPNSVICTAPLATKTVCKVRIGKVSLT
jgi:hypothetical protein